MKYETEKKIEVVKDFLKMCFWILWPIVAAIIIIGMGLDMPI